MRVEQFLAVLGMTSVAACAGAGTRGSAPLPPTAPAAIASGRAPTAIGKYIKHVVIIVQENRTFNNLFAGYPGAESTMHGYLHDGTEVPLHSTSFLGPDIGHVWKDAITDWNHGQMNGFDQYGGAAGPTYPYAYVERSLVAPYWTLAKRYVLADHMFPTMFGPSYTAHLDLVAGTANLRLGRSLIDVPTNLPWGCGAPAGTLTSYVNSKRKTFFNLGPYPCLTGFKTLADLLDAAGVSWRYYTPPSSDIGGKAFSVFSSIKAVRYGPDWANVVTPETRVLTDSAAGELPQVSWVVPDFVDSDHAGSESNTGPSWVASVVNAIGESKQWKSTAIVIVWDDWGGWYDEVAPPQLDFRGLGIRVPCLIVSPYAKRGYVSHTRYEFGSILKFVEQVYGLPTLASTGGGTQGYTDGRANSLIDSFDFTQKPRAYVPIAVPYTPSYFLKRPPSLTPPDNE